MVTASPSSASASTATHSHDILVVDDTPANLQLLSGMLKAAGYRVRVVPSGALALQSVASREPDLILLDINMPDLDGYEVCKRLKADPASASIPVIFISALSEPLDKVRAFGSGGVDYVTKPFQVEEVGARVRTHLEIRRLQRMVEERARELERKNEALRRSEQLRDNLVHMLVHDMRTPLSGLLASLHFLTQDTSELLAEESRTDLDNATAGARRIKGMIDDMLDISRLDAGKLTIERRPILLEELGGQVILSLGGLTKERLLSVAFPPDLVVSGDPELLRRVFVNLLGNALKFTSQAGRVTLAAAAVPSGVRLTVSDEGPGIDPRYHELIFEKFGQVETRRERVASHGLGLAFCKLAVEAHGGRIGVDSALGRGSVFWVELPHDD